MKLKLTNQQVWFTSDTHYGHKNICRGVSEWSNLDKTRNFNTVSNMNDVIVNNINTNVKEDDILFHLGDWSFGGFDNIAEFRNRINCKNVHLVYGNHDHHIINNKLNIQDVFSSTQQYLELSIRKDGKKYNFVLFHFPVASWNRMKDGVIHLHGHVHLEPFHRISDGKAMDVGVDGNNLNPISLDEILSIMEGQPISNLVVSNDHHTI